MLDDPLSFKAVITPTSDPRTKQQFKTFFDYIPEDRE